MSLRCRQMRATTHYFERASSAPFSPHSSILILAQKDVKKGAKGGGGFFHCKCLVSFIGVRRR